MAIYNKEPPRIIRPKSLEEDLRLIFTTAHDGMTVIHVERGVAVGRYEKPVRGFFARLRLAWGLFWWTLDVTAPS